MDTAQLMNAVLQEVQQIPVEHLPEVYRLLHDFRLQVESDSSSPDLLRFAGCWSDLLDETYNDLIADISTRRQQTIRFERLLKHRQIEAQP